ncbi:hypothetical protein [Hyalangium minutum]|uniref:Lipoprotein n=1 Tax=Hyalangium minutum TaxID=394096 RepID=A0A085VZJ0_9BACT|nr:hypothetical protein [Hyalangium minutum]KFE60853.1 hypothetical protein DB31_4766 [Hyalangium minutum]
MRHIILAGGILALTGCGALKPEARPEPEVAFTCRGRPPPPRSSVSHSNAPVGRLELKRLSPEPEPPASAPEGAPATPAGSNSSVGVRLPETRFRLIAEAAPLGALGAAMASELGMSVVVAAPLVDLRVSLALPDTDTARLLGLLRAHYGVGSTYNQGVLSLEEREELLERLLLVEPAPLITQLIPVEGLPAAQIASAWCEQAASSRGMASVVGKHLLVKDSEERIRILGRMIGALQGTQSLTEGQPDDERPEESPGVDLEP